MKTKIPFFLVTGFLGSGKTTLLKNLLGEYADTKKIAIVQNEFAPANIDGIDLKQTGKSFEILEINKGSVFCVCLLSDFITSLSEFIEKHQPEAIILESSGLSDPIAIVQLLQDEKLKDKVYLSKCYCIVDTTSFLKLNKLMTRLHHQIRVADIVVLNKTDLYALPLEPIIEIVKGLNPFAEIVSSTYCKIQLKNLFPVFQQLPVAVRNYDKNSAFESCGKPDNIDSFVIKTARKLSPENLEYFVKQLPDDLLRLKGFVHLTDNKTVAVQWSMGNYQIVGVEDFEGPTELIVMGFNLGKYEINKKFQELFINVANK